MAEPDKTPDPEETERPDHPGTDGEAAEEAREAALVAGAGLPSAGDAQPGDHPVADGDASEESEDGDGPHEIASRSATAPAKAARWEVLMREDSPPATAGGQPPYHQAPPSPRLRQWGMIARASLPLVVILVYATLKMTDGFGGPSGPPEIREQVSISGVRPDRPDVRVDRDTGQLLSQLEALRESARWNDIIALVDAQPEEQRGHPFLRAFRAIARAEKGEVSGGLLAELAILENELAGRSRSEDIRQYLRLMRAQVLLSSARTPQDLARNTDEYLRLVGGQPRLTPRVVKMRLELGSKYFTMARRLDEEAGNGMRVDRQVLQEARLFYQMALRWLTVPTPQGWRDMQPIADGSAAQLVARLAEALAGANQRYHGRTLPFTRSDSRTWTGIAGDPVHYEPRVAP